MSFRKERFTWGKDQIEVIKDQELDNKKVDVNFKMKSKSIYFHFHPYNYDKNQHFIEKSDGGKKRRYLCGVSSGLKEDGHGERMTEKCIKSFMDQANKGDVLLFADVHGIKDSQDIGILTKAEVLDNGDWYTEYRLYDIDDGIGNYKSETIDTVWKQVNGFPPYTKPRQKGFSIEGIIPEESIIKNSYERKSIDDVLLDGVLLVPRPAYLDSVSTAIFKALGETTLERRKALKESIQGEIMDKEYKDKYYSKKWELADALERVVETIMLKNNNNKKDELELIFNEYKDMMLELILNSERVFQPDYEEDIEIDEDEPRLDSINTLDEDIVSSKIELYKSLVSKIKLLTETLEA